MEQGEYISVEKLSELTGFSKSYIYKLTHWELIPFHKPTGGRLFFKLTEILEWMSSSRSMTIEEAKAKVYSRSKKLVK